MRKFFVFFVLFAGLFAFDGCAPKAWKSAQDAYESGNWENAVFQSVATLREKPGFEEATKMLKEVLPKAYDVRAQQAKTAEVSKDWDLAVSTYKNIQAITQAVASLPTQIDPTSNAPITFETKNVDKEYESAVKNAAEKHYQAGLSFEKSGQFKEAAKEFTRAQEYVPMYKDAATRYDKSRTAAVKRIAIMPFENKSGKTQFGEIGDAVTDNIISAAMSDQKNLEFMELVTRDRLNQLVAEQQLGSTGVVDASSAAKVGKVIGIHSFVFGKITSVTISVPPEKKTQTKAEQKFQSSEGPVHWIAMIEKIVRRATAKVNCSYQIVDVTKGTIVKSGSLPITEEIVIEFGRFTGDEDALDREQRQLCSKPDDSLPPEEEIVNRAVLKAAQNLSSEITAFFR